jgi:small subunit ribosomal protein S16
MVVIRMKRAGAKKRPFYRVVVADSRSPRDGRYIEQLGYYDPLTDPATFKVDAEKFALWIRRGATPSESVGVMMAKHAPEALRPAPLVAPAVEEVATPEMKAERKAKKKAAKTAKAAAKVAKKKAAKPAAKKAAKKKAAKGTDKKAKARAKKKSGVAPKRKVKKAKKKS